MDKLTAPIEELYPEMLQGYPKGTTWGDLHPGSQEGAMVRLFNSKFPVRIFHGSNAPREERLKDRERVEWSLRHGKVHPDLPVLPKEVAEDQSLTLD